MRKKIMKALSVMLAVVLIFTAAPLSGFVGLELPDWLDFSIISSAATSGTCGENVTWSFDESTGTLTISGTGAMYDYENNDNRPWKEYKADIINIVVSNGVTSTGKYAFNGLNIIDEIYLGDDVDTINSLPLNLKSISVSVNNKNYCSENSVLFDKDKTTLLRYPTNNSRESYVIPDSVRIISKSAFADNSFFLNSTYKLKKVIFGKNVTVIEESAFDECRSLEEVYFNSELQQIGKRAFAASALKFITIPDRVIDIGYAAFFGCSSLKTVVLGKNVETIGEMAFQSCESLESIIIFDNLKLIGNQAFARCYNLKDINYTGTQSQWNNISIGTYAFYQTNHKTNYNYIVPDDTGHIHNYITSTKQPTCTLDGYTKYVCSCGDSYIDYIPAIGHNFVNGVCTYCNFESNEPDNKSGTITITDNPIILASGDYTEHAITAVYNDASGNPVLDADIQWTVSDNSIAEIVKTQTAHGSTLIFKAKKDGAVKFTAHYLNETAVCYVFVGKMSPQLYINTSSVNQDSVGYTFDVTIGNFGCSAYNQQQIKEATAENVNVTIKLPDGFSFYPSENINEMTTLLLDGYSIVPGKSEKLNYRIYKIGEPASNKITITAKGSNTSECKQTVKIFTDGRDLTEENRKEINNSIKMSFEVLDDYKKIHQRVGVLEHGHHHANTIMESNEIPIKVTIYNSIPNEYHEYEEYIKSNSEFDCQVTDIKFETETREGGFEKITLNSDFKKTTIKAGEHVVFYGTAKIKNGYLPMKDNERQKTLSARVYVLIKEKTAYYTGSILLTVNNISYKGSGSGSTQTTNPSTALKKIPNAECSLVGLMELGLSNEQCTYLSKLILTELSIYSIPTQSLEEYISEKILKKVFGYKKLLSAGNGEFVITIPLEMNGEKIEIDLINTVSNYTWNGTGIGNIDSISYEAYKIEKGFLGSEKRAKTPYKTDVAGVATIANVKEFFEAVCDYTLDSVKSATKSVLGNVKEVERFLFGDCALSILNSAGYDTFFDYGWSIYVNECKEVAFECPVDIYVYNQNDELCGTIINNVPTSMDDEIELEVVNDTKIVRMYSSGYYIKTVSTCKGKLSVSVTERDYNNGARRIVTYDNLPLDIGTEYVQNYGDGFNVEASTYDIIFEDGSKETPDNEILLLEENFNVYDYTFSIQSPSRTEIRNKDGIILHGVVDGMTPNGSYVKWESSNGNFDKSADGSNLKIIAKNKGYTTFTAILCDADGNELARDSIEMYSKSGFFDKIGGFFRSLFGTTKIYDN